MPLRPAPLSRHPRTLPHPRRFSFHPPHTTFHTTAIQRTDSAQPTHYELLQLPPSASVAEIKKQFFALSKKYHPDKNPSDPTASTRFVQISEAYHVLSIAEKRSQYDRELAAAQSRWGGGGGGVPKGSYSSAQGFAGSRAPSGLSRRRTQFRGPPPSFYKSGGYGKQGAKRAEHAYQHTPGAGGEAEEGAEGSEGVYGGFGPGQTSHGNEVPHFDDMRHKRMHDSVNEYISQKRRQREGGRMIDELGNSGMIINFVLVSGTLGFIVWTLSLFGKVEKKGGRKKEDS